MKSVKKLLKENRSRALPDDGVKDRIKRELGMTETQTSLALAGGGERTRSGRKKALIAIIAAAAAVVLALGIILPVALRPSSPAPSPLPGGNKFLQITDAESFYAYGAASVGTMLSSGTAYSSAARSAALTSAHVLSAPSDAAYDELTATADRYMSLVESLLGSGEIDGTVTETDGEYAYSMNISYSDLLGGTVSYVMMYNRTLTDSETDGDEKEEEYAIDGVLVVGDTRYPVEGKYETEEEEDETGSEMSFRAYTSADRRSYIAAEQEHESETEGGESETEIEYVYTVVVDGEETERTTVEYEYEGDELELVMTVKNDGSERVLEFSDESKGGERVLRVESDIDGKRISFRIYVRDGKYHYVFSDGSSEDHDRRRD